VKIAHLRVRSNSSSAHDDEQAALPALDNDRSVLALLSNAPLPFLNAAVAEVDETSADEEDV
jgi:hypothetical protein